MTKTKTEKTREQWLEQATRAINGSVFKAAGYAMPAKWRVTCGWGKGSSKHIGMCYPPQRAEDGETTHMFISPVLGDAVTVLATLVHEMGHAAVGCEHQHKKPFKDFMRAVGLEGKATATVPGATLAAKLARIGERLGDYPHVTLRPITKDGKGGGGWVRYESVLIEGYKVVIGPKSLEDYGPPRDPYGCSMVPDGTDAETKRCLAEDYRTHDEDEEEGVPVAA